jgi:sulfur carrier protein
MRIKINGEETTLDEPCTVEQLLVRSMKTKGPCAVEINRSIVPRKNHAQRIIADGDEIEIVTLVGGG